jgi:hypothetical protein
VKRRSLLRGLLGLPFVAALAPLLSKTPAVTPPVDSHVWPLFDPPPTKLLTGVSFWADGVTKGTGVLFEATVKINDTPVSRWSGRGFTEVFFTPPVALGSADKIAITMIPAEPSSYTLARVMEY